MDGDRAMIADQEGRVRAARETLDACSRWRWWKRIGLEVDLEDEERILFTLRGNVSNRALGRLESAARLAESTELLLRCLDYFRNYDLERTDGRGPSPIVADLEAALRNLGSEIPVGPTS